MASQRPAGKTRPPSKESTGLRDVGPDTVWHTRGLQTPSRLRAPVPGARRTPRRQLPPSRVPRLLAWGLVLVMVATFVQAFLRMHG
ncbi:hypothetical protein [Cupriavidus necator]|uniref:hypothetical protein n=1 Tax=Cupriavidus necator TaxID=106590 RepID=UPI00068A3D6E|nr:hypothetical protein [Cupriavidus necator]